MSLPSSKSALAVSRPEPDDLLRRWREGRALTRVLFDRYLPEDSWFENPIPLRHPFVFYEGHLAAFAVNTLVKKALKRPGIDPMLERLFERGIDPGEAGSGAPFAWPTRARVMEYVRRAEDALESALRDALLEAPAASLPLRREAAFNVVEHELLHQETLLYMLRELPTAMKRRPPELAPLRVAGDPPAGRTLTIPRGRATLGADRDSTAFGWDNEFPRAVRDVPAFSIDVFPVTNAGFLDFVEAGGYREPSFWDEGDFAWVRGEGIALPHFWGRRDGQLLWRGQFEDVPLPLSWPCWVTRAEAAAYARFRGRRLPTEAEWHRAAFGRPDGGENDLPWGDAPADPCLGNFGGIAAARFDPVSVDAFPAGQSAFGVHDLVGNGWEWTATKFGPFPGFQPRPFYPGYSQNFFDEEHYVMKGGSPVTAACMLRRSFRNWFRPNYPYVYASFRVVED
jgi:gamma-glutamyl hercynylcysteine S-oxide synthase